VTLALLPTGHLPGRSQGRGSNLGSYSPVKPNLVKINSVETV
jgi:hypothetical protein